MDVFAFCNWQGRRCHRIYSYLGWYDDLAMDRLSVHSVNLHLICEVLPPRSKSNIAKRFHLENRVCCTFIEDEKQAFDEMLAIIPRPKLSSY